MSFHETVSTIRVLIEELQDYHHSCDLDRILTDMLCNAEYLRDETYVCDDCGRILSDERAYVSEYDGSIYCNCCYERNKTNSPISKYHENKGCFEFKNLGETYPVYYRGLEVELETDLNDEVYDVLRRADSSLFRFEEDGSLQSGFEIITCPMSRLYWNKLGFFKLEKLIDNLKKVSNPRAWNTGRCGLHIHFNRVEVSNVAQKFLKKFMVENHDFITKISGRDVLEYCRNPVYEDYEIDCNDNIYNYSRYLTLNFTEETLEFRFWRGTLKTENIKACVQLTEDLIGFAEFAVRCDEFNATEKDFIKYITDNRPELHEFKNARRARWNRHYKDNND